MFVKQGETILSVVVNSIIKYLSQLMRLWYLSHRRPAKALASLRESKTQASLRIRAVSPDTSLFAYMKYGSRQMVRPKIRHLAPTGWLRMRVWRISLRRTKSAIISWHESFRIWSCYFLFVCWNYHWYTKFPGETHMTQWHVIRLWYFSSSINSLF